MQPTGLNENLISRCKSLVASLYVEPPKEAEVSSFERQKHQTDFSIKSTKTGVQTKLERKSQQSAPQEDKPDETSKRDRKEETAKFAIDLSD